MIKAIPTAAAIPLMALALASAHAQDFHKICKTRGGDMQKLAAQDTVQSCRAIALGSGKAEYAVGCQGVQDSSLTMWTLPIKANAEPPPFSIMLLIDDMSNRELPPDTVASCAAAWRQK